MSRPHKIKNLGQVFTPEWVAEQMLSLRKNRGNVLEPSCGNGIFVRRIYNDMEGGDVDAYEIDPDVGAPPYAEIKDFFATDLAKLYSTIIGNPPYVRFRDIPARTKRLLDSDLFDERASLYLFFIERCIRQLKPGGELIFITPADFLKSTSAIRLNKWLHSEGTITHIIKYGDRKLFKGVSPNCIAWRFEKGLFDRDCNVLEGNGGKWRKGRFSCSNGQISFSRQECTEHFSHWFFVKVGAVSGADAIFANPEGNMDFVCSRTRVTGETRRMIYGIKSPLLAPFKKGLLARGIRKFYEDDWHEWGRGYFASDRSRIYVNCKTRIEKPFFVHSCNAYDGSVLALFPRKYIEYPAQALCDALNGLDWDDMGFKVGGRFIFSQRALENCQLPSNFRARVVAKAGG